MAIYIKGNPVANATSYELFEKLTSDNYSSIMSNSAINFQIDTLPLSAGKHIFVVKAKADGYDDSDYSNEVEYTVAVNENEIAGTWLMNEVLSISKASFGGTKGSEMGFEGMNLYCGYKVNYTIGPKYASDALLTHTSVEGILAYRLSNSNNAGFLFNDGKWSANTADEDGQHRLIIETKLADVPNGDKLLTWLKANGVKIA